MSKRLFKKDIVQMFDFVIRVPYAGLDRCLKNVEKVGHTERLEGWGMDVFKVKNNICITSGYDIIRGAYVVPRELVQEYEEKIREVPRWTLPFEEEKEILNGLLEEFAKKALEVGKRDWR